MRALFITLAILLVPASASTQEAVQTDWSGGGGAAGPVADWGHRFDSASGTSSLSVPGQLALSGTALAFPSVHLLSDAYQGTIGVAVGDVDGDGDMDVVGTAQTTQLVTLFVNEGGDPVTWSEQTIATPAGAAGVDLADIDSDGDLDVVIMCVAPRNKILLRLNEGGDPIIWSNHVIQNPWYDAWEISTGDVNGDGHMDVMCTCWSMGDVSWWRNDGNNPITWTENLVDGNIFGAHSVRGADFDEDGDMDLAVAAGMADKIAVYWNDGQDPIGWTMQVVRENFEGARSVWIGDIDRDGDPDIAGICWESDLAWWRNDGGDSVSWTEQTICTDCHGGHACCIADINGDGRPDILGACSNSNKIAWWENGGGNPITWTERILAGHWEGAITVRAADLDGDGDVDPVGASWTMGEFSWWEATAFASPGDLTSSILDTGEKSRLGAIDWTSIEPAGTSVAFQVRSSDDPADPGAWSADITNPGALPEPLDRYIQYRVFLDTTDPDVSPILHDVTFGPGMTAVEIVTSDLPAAGLSAHPNPFNPAVTIAFGLRTESSVRLDVLNVEGRRVRSLAGTVMAAGDHRIDWDGRNDHGQALPSGVYWVRLETPDIQDTQKLVLLR